MIYSSKGLVVAKGVVNPSNVLAEYYNAYQIAAQTSQWQWKEEAFPDIASFETPSIIDTEAEAVTYIWDGDDHSDAGHPTLTFGADRWMVPTNSSYAEVGDGDIAMQWTSEYPELVLCAFSFQYVRDPNRDGSAISMARTKIQISVDGHLQQGTGPYDKGENTNYPYGSGSQEHSMAQTVVCMLPLQAGAHRVTAVAAQADSSVRYATGGLKLEIFEWFNNVLTFDQLAQIGNRRMIVIRLPKSAWLRAA